MDLTSLQAEVEEHFNTADGDGDGTLTPAELASAPYRLADTNGDEMVSEEEFLMADLGSFRESHNMMDRTATVFSLADADGNGQLSSEEFQALPLAMHRARQQSRFERLDVDGDGLLSLSETSPRLNQLQALDGDGDGQLTRQEAQSMEGKSRNHDHDHDHDHDH